MTRARWGIAGAVLVVLGVLLWLATRPPPLTIQGEVSANRVDISSRVAGRVVKLNVNVGDTVQKGAVLAELDDRDARLALEQVHRGEPPTG